MLVNKSRVIAGAIAAAAVAFPLSASLTTPDAQTTAAPRCLAWFGNQADGHCLSYSNGTGATIGTPQIGLGQGGIYYESPPLLPGTTINRACGS